MRGLRFFLWGGVLAMGAYGFARLFLLPGREVAREATGRREETPPAEHFGVEVPGPTFAEKTEAVRQLKRDNRPEEAIRLLLKLVATAEEEAIRSGSGMAIWYYEQLAILYRKEGRIAQEVGTLERYLAAQKRLGRMPATQMEKRLARARELLAG